MHAAATADGVPFPAGDITCDWGESRDYSEGTRGAPSAPQCAADLLLQVPGDELRHLEHRNGLLAVEDGLERVVGIDLGLFLGVLKLVFLDVNPELLGEFRARERIGTNDGSELLVRLDGLHECCVRFAGGFFGFRHGVACVVAATNGDKPKISMISSESPLRVAMKNRDF